MTRPVAHRDAVLFSLLCWLRIALAFSSLFNTYLKLILNLAEASETDLRIHTVLTWHCMVLGTG